MNVRYGGKQLMMDVRSVGFEKPPGGSIGSDFHVLQDHTNCC